MKIAIIADWFSEKMGYAENCLPKALASLGHETHLITSNVQTYFNSPTYKETYEPFIGPGIVACESRKLDGYTLHRLSYGQWRGRLRIRGLRQKLIELCPQIVQTFDVTSLTTLEAALCKLSVGYELFLESHLHASVFPPALGRGSLRDRIYWTLYANTFGRFVSRLTKKCYPISTDAAEIVIRFFGIDSGKVDVVPLGVDTDLFCPPDTDTAQQTRKQLRQSLGFAPNEVVCVYTGRFSKDKNPLCLAHAIGKLVAEGGAVRGLFVGNGPAEDVAAIRRTPGCVVQPFVPTSDLPPYYWAADIGVWPKQESTSQLDAAACGLPLILSNKVKVIERVEGNGLLYEQDNPADLARRIRQLADPEVRHPMGQLGVRKVHERFSWLEIARQRLQDYEAAWQNKRTVA
jgi:glycosyltransferase involved in cell wall biosynthesis